MPTIEVHRAIDGERAIAVHELLDAVEQATGHQALSDHLAADLAERGGPGFLAATASATVSEGDTGDRRGRLIGYAQASPANRAHAVEVVVDPAGADRTGPVAAALLAALIEAIGRDGGGTVNWLVFAPQPEHEEIARANGMRTARTLHQMCRELPTGIDAAIETRPFAVGTDDEQWLEVNNRAFAGHGEQGGWTLETLRQRQREDWFDPQDVLVHERDGRIVAFCWTKRHPARRSVPALGEIYVIAVHPDHHGEGLGRRMTLAGLEHLARLGFTTGMLWVDADNDPAVHLYERLGFEVAATTVAFTAEVPPSPPTASAGTSGV